MNQNNSNDSYLEKDKLWTDKEKIWTEKEKMWTRNEQIFKSEIENLKETCQTP